MFAIVESLAQTIPFINPVKYLIRRPHEIYSCQMLFAFVLSFCSYKRESRMFQSCDKSLIQYIINYVLSNVKVSRKLYLICKIFINNIIN